ncbi:MAG: glycosyltransferase [Actinobacteria bacterium]|nr:glycosyltransferase [Actinomycetota bacterium]MBI3686319.1 glycosyltransferase [Actinomycetota bacterium]
MTSRVVFCAGTSYDGLIGSDRHLATALSAHAPVLWVDPPVSVVTPQRFRGAAGRRLTPRLTHLDSRLVRLTPAALPGWSRPGVRATTWPLVRAQVRWALRRLAATPRAVVACSLDDVLTGWAPGVRRVLYGTDDYVAGARLMGQDAARLERDERRQLARADLVLAVSPVLRDRWTGQGVPEVVVLPNGCDAERFAGADEAPWPASLPADRPIAGLIGQLSDRIDIALLEAVADLGSLLLVVGPLHPGWEPERFAALTRRPNVRYAGEVGKAELAGYLGAIDVGLTPYRDSAFNRASFPLKTLEYLAAGRPVVSTDLPATRWLATDLITTAGTPTGFAAAVREAFSTARRPDLVVRRRAFAAGHSWARRAGTLAGLLDLRPRDAVPATPTPSEDP